MNLEMVVAIGGPFGTYIPIDIELDDQYFNFDPKSHIESKKEAIDKMVKAIMEFYNIEPIKWKLDDGRNYTNYRILGCILNNCEKISKEEDFIYY